MGELAWFPSSSTKQVHFRPADDNYTLITTKILLALFYRDQSEIRTINKLSNCHNSAINAYVNSWAENSMNKNACTEDYTLHIFLRGHTQCRNIFYFWIIHCYPENAWPKQNNTSNVKITENISTELNQT